MLHLHRRSGLAGAAVAAALLAASGPVAGAGQRSFVSTKGVDKPTCSITSPCRGFNAAITATSAGGEMIALDSGSYGQMTITKSVSIILTSNAAEVRLAGTAISRNATGIAYVAGGLALSQGNNLIDGNTADGAAPTIVGAK